MAYQPATVASSDADCSSDRGSNATKRAKSPPQAQVASTNTAAATVGNQRVRVKTQRAAALWAQWGKSKGSVSAILLIVIKVPAENVISTTYVFAPKYVIENSSAMQH